MRQRWLALVLLGYTSQVQAALSTVGTFCGSFPFQCQRGTIALLGARGTGTDTMYIMEVDPATGNIPTTATVTVNYSAATGAAVPANAAYIGLNNGGNMIGAVGDSSGRQIVAGAGTAGTAAGGVLTVQGSASGTAIPVTVASLPTTSDTNFGTPGSSTLRTAAMLGMGSTAVSASNPVFTEATNGTSAVAFGTGADGATVPRVTLSTRAETVTTPLAAQLSNGSAAVAYGTGADGATVLRTTLSTRAEAVATPLAAQLSNGSAAVAYGTGADGATVLRVTPSTRSETATTPLATNISNGTSFADFNVGAAASTTLRVIGAGRPITSSIVANNTYSSTNVTTSAYVQLIASTANAINEVCVSDSSGSIMKLATGAAASEVDRIYIPAGGAGCYNVNVAASTRISLEALDATANTGNFIFTGY